MTEAFDYETPFELSMTFPMIEESSDRLRMKSETLKLAKEVLDTISLSIGLPLGTSLPPDIVKEIFTKLSFLDREDIDSWMAAAEEAKEDAEKEAEKEAKKAAKLGLQPNIPQPGMVMQPGIGMQLPGGQKPLQPSQVMPPKEEIIERCVKRITPQLVEMCSFKVRQSNSLKEGVMHGKHFYSSTNLDNSQRITLKTFKGTLKKEKVSNLKD
jgi:hypothetical protein